MQRTIILAAILWAAGPALAQAPEQVKCKDGTMGKAGKGACSHHGGVDKGATAGEPTTTKTPSAAPAPDVKPAPPAGAATGVPVKCKDGTMGTSGKGACSHHGGVDKGEGPAKPSAAPASTAAPTPAAPPNREP